METTLKKYGNIVRNIPSIIEKSGLRDGFIAEKIGMKQGNFSAKKTRNTWKFNEVEKILETVLNSTEDVEDYLLALEMEAMADEPNIPISELKTKLNWK
jgi:CRISPR/Cas system CMR-associated protein Cmr5 small subunit